MAVIKDVESLLGLKSKYVGQNDAHSWGKLKNWRPKLHLLEARIWLAVIGLYL